MSNSKEVEIFKIENPTVVAVVEALTSPDREVRWDDVEAEFGIAEKELRRWRRDKTFQRLLWEETIGAIQGRAHEIIKGLHRTATGEGKNQVVAAKLLLEVIERYKPAAVRYLEEKDAIKRTEEVARLKSLQEVTAELRELVKLAGLEGVIDIRPVEIEDQRDK